MEPTAEAPPRLAARPWGFWATLGLALTIGVAYVFIQFVVGVVMVAVAGMKHGDLDLAGLEMNGLYWALACLASSPVLIGLSWLFAAIREGMSAREYLRLRRVAGRTVFRWCLASLVLFLVSDTVTSLLGRPIVPEVMVSAYRTARVYPLFWLAIIVVAPVAEEIFFRGFLFEGLLHSRLGGWGAILLTSLVWAAIHLQYDAYGIAIVFAGGLLLGCARWKTGSIYTSIVMHALMNLLATIQVMSLVRYLDQPGAGLAAGQ